MSIKFTSNNPQVSDVLIIGGKDDAFSGQEKGGYGPFPSYSISREEILAEDGSYLNTKFSITINGNATIKTSDTSSVFFQGERQSKIFGEKIIKLQFNRNQFPMAGNGTLEIVSYGGDTNTITFNEARLVSVDTPEDPDETSGIHYAPYSFTFEAYSINDNTLPIYMVSAVGESWEIKQNDNQFSFISNNLTGLPFKTYTLTHTLTATGLKKYDTNGSLATDGDAWRQAAKWIESRLIDNPSSSAISSHIDSKIDGPKFVPFFMDSSTATNKNIDLSDARFGISYKAFNHSRTSNTDISGAGYNVTDTWLLAVDSSKCLHELQSSIENSQESSSISVTVNGSIIGLQDQSVVSNKDNKYKNANDELSELMSSNKPFEFANQMYSGINPLLKDGSRKLRNVIIKKSVGHNKITGTITWSITYNDQDIIGDESKIASEEISINYDNSDLSTRQIAIIPVIGRPRGPIIQNFSTNKERKVSLTLDLMMKKEHRPNSPPKDVANTIIQQYQPFNSFVNSRSDNWNPKTGVYNISIEWIYK